MATARGRGTLAVVVAAGLLIAGAVIGVVVGDALAPPARGIPDAPLGADRDLVVAWTARGLLLLAAAWVLIGMLAARTRLVRRPGAAAARATWLGSTRPWRARESTLGLLPLDRWMMLLVPGGLLVATRLVQTSFLSWTHPALVFSAWIAFVIVVRVLVGRRSPWPIIAAVGGVVVLRCSLTLAAISLTGPGGSWFVFWTDPVLRTLYFSVAFALFAWLLVAAGWALSPQFGERRSVGIVLAGLGAGAAVPSAAVAAIGLERLLTTWNDEHGMLPWSLPGTTLPEIPDAAALVAAALGLIVCVAGILLARPPRPGAPAAS